MIGYLSSITASQSMDILREELEVHQSFTEVSVKKYEGLLERKWTSNARLQKRVSHASIYIVSAETTQPRNIQTIHYTLYRINFKPRKHSTHKH